MTTEHSDDIVRLAHGLNPTQAHILEQALKEEGIRCKVVGDYLEVGFGNLSGVSAEVWVHQDDLDKAQAIMAKGEHHQAADAAEEE
ncbi:MAG: DUF2007 domain-containing protein, partial [Gemmataceae bacterium]